MWHTVKPTCLWKSHQVNNNNNQPTILQPLYRLTCIGWHLQLRSGGFVGAEFYCLHAPADDNQRIQIREKMLEFSTLLFTLSPYLQQNDGSVKIMLIYGIYSIEEISTISCVEQMRRDQKPQVTGAQQLVWWYSRCIWNDLDLFQTASQSLWPYLQQHLQWTVKISSSVPIRLYPPWGRSFSGKIVAHLIQRSL